MIVFFDLDNTLLRVNLSVQFGRYLRSKQALSLRALLFIAGAYFFYRLSLISLKTVHRVACRYYFCNRSLIDLKREAEGFVNLYLGKWLNTTVVARLKEYQRGGAYVAILSNSPEFLVEVAARFLGVFHWVATSYSSDSQGVIKGIGFPIDGAEKAEKLREIAKKLNIPLEQTVAFSDSYSDFPLLAVAGKAIGVNPDMRLRRACIKNGWEIL